MIINAHPRGRIGSSSPLWILAAACLLLTLGMAPSAHAQANSQEDPAPPPAVIPVDQIAPPAPVDRLNPHVSRHKMRDPRSRARRREIDALEKLIDKLRTEIEVQGTEVLDAARMLMQAELKKAHGRLEALQLSEDLEKIDVEVPPYNIRPPGRRSRYVTRDHERIAFFDHIYIETHEHLEAEAIAFFGDIHVMGEVNDIVVSIGGDVYITGTVTDEVVAPFGNVYLGENAIVEGDIVAIDVFAEKGAIIDGTVRLVHLPYLPFSSRGTDLMLTLLVSISVLLGFTMLLGLLIQVAAPANVDRVEARIRGNPVGVFLGGILVQILTLPVFTLLVVTLIGIPVAFLVLPLVLLAALLLGYVAVSRILGEALIRREGSRRLVALSFILGAVILITPLIIGVSLKIPSGIGTNVGATILAIMGNTALFLGMAVMYIASTAGLGAAVVSRLGFRDRKEKGAAKAESSSEMPHPSGAETPLKPLDPLSPPE